MGKSVCNMHLLDVWYKLSLKSFLNFLQNFLSFPCTSAQKVVALFKYDAMSPEILIQKILSTSQASSIFHRAHFRKDYVRILKMLHPDICPHPQASEALAKVHLWKEKMEGGISDDAGHIHMADAHTFVIKGQKELLQHSLEQYQALMQLKDEASLHFRRYLPEAMYWEGDDLHVRTKEQAMSLHELRLPEQHVTWLTSRMLEFTAWLHQSGYVHAALLPESLAVVPETHGIVCLTFYHMRHKNSMLRTLSGRYAHWYPPDVFNEKRALPSIDLSLLQKTALYVLGDPSGSGVKLKKDCNEAFIDFLIQSHDEAYTTFDRYRKLLESLFGKPRFYPLELPSLF